MRPVKDKFMERHLAATQSTTRSTFKRTVKKVFSPLAGSKEAYIKCSTLVSHKTIRLSAGRKLKVKPGTPSDSLDDAVMTRT
jgi:hypothetical protein